MKIDRLAFIKVLGVGVMTVFLSSVANAGSVGMVLDITGSATAQSGSERAPLDIATPLQVETRISLAKGSEISFVFYPAREQFTVAGPAVFWLGEQGVKLLSGVAPRGKKLQDDRAHVVLGFQNQVVPAAFSMKTIYGSSTAPKLQKPVEGETVLSDQPEFEWAAVESGPVELSIWHGETVVYQQRVEGATLALPADVALTRGQEYRWRVASNVAQGRKVSNGHFTVASAQLRADVQRVKPVGDASTSDWVIYAMALDQAGMRSEAGIVWRRVAQRRPDSHKLRELAQ